MSAEGVKELAVTLQTNTSLTSLKYVHPSHWCGHFHSALFLATLQCLGIIAN
jgi:hypothetical protein